MTPGYVLAWFDDPYFAESILRLDQGEVYTCRCATVKGDPSKEDKDTLEVMEILDKWAEVLVKTVGAKLTLSQFILRNAIYEGPLMQHGVIMLRIGMKK